MNENNSCKNNQSSRKLEVDSLMSPDRRVHEHKWVNPNMPSGPVHPHQLEESISDCRVEMISLT